VNCRDGHVLTVADLEEIALAGGISAERISDLHAAHHNRNLIRSYLLQWTTEARLAMFWRGELDLDTSEAMLGG
jgi:hypothetical protein